MMALAARPPRKKPMPIWCLSEYGDFRQHRVKARIGRWLRSFLSAADLDDEWLDRQARSRLSEREKQEAA